MKLTQIQADNLIEQIKKDCEFFEQNEIIDYSLLIGIHNNSKMNNNNNSFINRKNYKKTKKYKIN